MTGVIDLCHNATHPIVMKGTAQKLMDRLYAVCVEPTTLRHIMPTIEFCYLSLFDETHEQSETALLSRVNSIDAKQGLVFIEVLYYGE